MYSADFTRRKRRLKRLIPVLLMISAIEQKSDHAKIFCVLKIYLKKRE